MGCGKGLGSFSSCPGVGAPPGITVPQGQPECKVPGASVLGPGLGEAYARTVGCPTQVPSFGVPPPPPQHPFGGQNAFLGFPAECPYQERRKEADCVELGPLPTAARFRAWKLEVKRSVAAASTRPQEAFAWVSEVDGADPSAYHLAFPTEQYQTLDVKLASALWKSLGHGDLARKLHVVAERMSGG